MSQNQQIQIVELNSIVKATVGVSKIHGVGVIAVTKIGKGQKLYLDKMPQVYNLPYASLKQLFPEVRKIILDRWPVIINGSRFVYPDIKLTSLLNHSENDNYDPATDTAKCDILTGEEVLINYKSMPNYEKIWPDIKLWLNVSDNAEQQLKRSTSVVGRVISLIRSWLRS